MRRVTKRFIVLIFGVFFTYFYCEYAIYYITVAQCKWPKLEVNGIEKPLKAFILADIHMLGPWRGHWLDKWRREWQMHQGYQAIISVHKPDVVFILGDVFDEGEWTNERQFKDYVERFYRLFYVPTDIFVYIAVGNHDIGFHNNIRRGFAQRFEKKLNSPSVQHVVLKDNHFILVNSMALHGDKCNLCTEARAAIKNISDVLKCSEDVKYCKQGKRANSLKYSRPILMQHFPLYRVSDAVCTEPDAPPLPERNKAFRLKIDSLSEEATDYLISSIKPRVVFGGHTHHGCLIQHSHSVQGETIKFEEHSVPSFSWRNRLDPKYMLMSITPDAHSVHKCGLPLESTIILTAATFIIITVYLTFRRRNIGRL